MEAEVFPLIEGWTDRLTDELVGIVRVPAPTGDESRRARYLLERWRALGLRDPRLDDIGNVVGVLPGAGGGPRILICSNMDTVYRDVDCTPRLEGGVLRGPGTWMNASGIAVMLGAVAALGEARVRLPGDLVVASTVGEEGGDFRGMRHLVAEWGGRVDAIFVVGNVPGTAHHRTLGRRVYEINAKTAGGHPYGNYGLPSALHVLIHIASELLRTKIPSEPPTSVNVGVLEGGIAPQAIAAHARAVIEVRSPDLDVMDRLEATLHGLVTARRAPGVMLEIAETDRSPFGTIPDDHPLVRLVYESHRRLGLTIKDEPVNCDVDVALAAGIPAVVHGAVTGGMTHSPNEFSEPASLLVGVRSLLMSLALVMERYPRDLGRR